MIKVNIFKTAGSFTLDMNFETESRRLGILGSSGSGKSMTLKCIAGIEKPDSGYISVDGHVLFSSADKICPVPQKRNTGYMFQNYALFPNMTVRQNIGAGVKEKGAAKEKRVDEMINRFSLAGLEDRYPGQLSGGQQQRVALARIMAYEPDVILLDEPFSALDVYLKDRLQTELYEMLNDYSGHVIMVSHSRDEIYRFADEILVIKEGRVQVQGKTKEVFADPVSKEAAVLTGCKNFCDIEKIDAHTFRCIQWGVTVKTDREIPDYAVCIGYRAHDFIPYWEEGGIPVDVISSADYPFEKNFYIRTQDEDNVLSWFVQRDMLKEIEERGMPVSLGIDPSSVLFLSEERIQP